MNKLLLALILLLAPAAAQAQCNGVFPNNTACGNVSGSSNTPRAIPLSSFPAYNPVITPDTYAAMKLIDANLLVDPITVITRYYATAGDRGGSIYDWDPASTATINEPYIVKNTNLTNGRYVLRNPESIHPEQGGVKCNGNPFAGTGTDDATALNTLITATYTLGGGTIQLWPGTWCRVTSANINVKTNVVLRGEAPAVGTTSSSVCRYTGGIALASTRTVVLETSASLRDLLVFRDGLTCMPATFAYLTGQIIQWYNEGSTAIGISGEDALVANSMAIGFGWCIIADGGGRPNIQNFNFDCANGIAMENIHDTLNMVHTNANGFWSFNINGTQGLWDVLSVDTAGAGYVTGNVLTATLTGMTCSTPATVTITAAAGAVTGGTVTSQGQCTPSSPGNVITNPVTMTGGAGAGAKLNLIASDATYRPGIGYYFSIGEGGNTFNTAVIGYQTAYVINNWFGLTLTSPVGESGKWNQYHSPTGIQTTNCTAETTIMSPYIDSFKDATQFLHKSAADGGSCVGAANQTASVSVIGGHIGTSLTNSPTLLFLGAFSVGSISDVTFAGGSAPQAVAEASTSWNIGQVVATQGVNPYSMWLLDATAAISFTSIGVGTPASAADPCAKGQKVTDASYIYSCVAADTWVRLANGATW